MTHPRLSVTDLGRRAYAEAYDLQVQLNADVLARRADPASPPGELLLVEHDPVITVSRRPGAAEHVLASAELLERHGVDLARTDRGGDVTYHGPGQLVAYPILDLKRLALGIHEHVRLMESSVIDTLARFGVEGMRDPEATGVWVRTDHGSAKICAIGVRVRRWVTMHGLAINVRPDLSHFGLIVPCGLHGRAVTSLERILGDQAPSMDEVKRELARSLQARIDAHGAG
ncbi:MAG: lipoyl(octanoyl) transferase LipB [Phycisphaerales bacterium JB059]